MNQDERRRLLKEIEAAAALDGTLAAALASHTGACAHAVLIADAAVMRCLASHDTAGCDAAIANRDDACTQALSTLHAAYDAARRRLQGGDRCGEGTA